MRLVDSTTRRDVAARYDDLGNTLGHLARRLDGLLLRGDDEGSPEVELRHLRLLTTNALHALRGIVEADEARSFGSGSLPGALAHLGRAFEDSTGGCVDLRVIGDVERVPDRVADVLRDIARETFANVIHDARCTVVVVRLHVDADSVVLDIADDGIDLAQRQVAAWRSAVELGLRRMSGASRSVHGRLAVCALEPRGLRIRATVPLPARGRR